MSLKDQLKTLSDQAKKKEAAVRQQREQVALSQIEVDLPAIEAKLRVAAQCGEEKCDLYIGTNEPYEPYDDVAYRTEATAKVLRQEHPDLLIVCKAYNLVSVSWDAQSLASLADRGQPPLAAYRLPLL
ncbi:hypothetical protein Rctr197k_232 [Virus Rctr197k]|nr:hypothetical protein Rctr197k_232 [Virus Rctr197k]